MKKRVGAVALLTMVAMSFVAIRSAHAELVFEDDLDSISEVKKEKPSLDSEEIEEQGSGDSLSKRISEKKEVSRSEKLRRHRMRAELKNEDKLTEKLEELRLKDELKRLEALSGVEKKEQSEAPVVAVAQPVVAQPVAQDQKVGSLASQQVENKSEAKIVEEKESKEDKMVVGITPHGGLASIINSNGFEVSSKYSFGITLHADFWEHIGFETSFIRSEYNLSAGNAFSYNYYGSYTGMTMQTLNMSQNVFEIGPRFNILGRKSKVQPYVSAGIGYYRSSISLDDATKNFVRMYNPALAQDYSISGFLGSVGGGVEYKISENIGIMGMFKYHNVFSANQSNPISSAAFVGSGSQAGYGYYGMNTMGVSDSRYQASKNLGKASFYTLQGGITISF